MGSSQWAVERFGDAAGELRRAVVAGIQLAHGDAVAAQEAGGTPKQDPYGHTLKRRQYERITAKAQGIAGVDVFYPHGTSLELVRVLATGVVLFPWRYATDNRVSLAEARMRVSGFRRELLSSGPAVPGQLNFDHATLDAEDLEAQLAEDEAVAEQLRSFACVVTVAFASNRRGLFRLGWGEAELVEGENSLAWKHWEPLPVRGSGGQADGDGLDGPSGVGPRPAPPTNVSSTATSPSARFDGEPLDDDLGLRPRSPLAGEPQREAGSVPPGTAEKNNPPS